MHGEWAMLEILTSEDSEMKRLSNDRKMAIWIERLARYRASGATVARFCKGESVSVNSFYHWSKRIAMAATGQSSVAVGQSSAAAGNLVASNVRSNTTTTIAMVQFAFQGGCQISVPAECLEVIASLVQAIMQRPSRLETQAFHQVVVGTR